MVAGYSLRKRKIVVDLERLKVVRGKVRMRNLCGSFETE